ncbi:MAG: DUF3880 domain-containing protein, partial [Lachnospiraceae bacterium]|nr:DUF3880 domain-containing protein [Lachnospiraceae bacterium]
MNILVYRYGSICEPDIINTFNRLGLNVIEESAEITNKKITPSERLKLVENILKSEQLLFVFSINFYPVIADICSIYNTIYLCWTVDSPVPELFSASIRHNTNRIFLFDYTQYQYFSPYNPDNIKYLPLASCTERFDRVISTISDKDRKSYNKDISFIGS